MNTSGLLKVTVNGKKYLITGIQKETSCKDLLCAIAKVTKHSLSAVTAAKKSEEKAFGAVYGVKNSEIKCDENLLEQFKGDREKVGDFESLKVFNSLGEKAKIYSRERKTIAEGLYVDESLQVNNKKRKKKKKGLNEEHKLKSKENVKTLRLKEKQREKSVLTKVEKKSRRRKLERSVDDSDLESYKRSHKNRISSQRVHDDSDLDLYKELFYVVVDQTKSLRKLHKQSKDERKVEWVKKLQKSTQVYHFHNEVTEKDEENDSGIPSPEYDSSESHVIQVDNLEQASQITHDTEAKINKKDKQILDLNHNMSSKNKHSSYDSLPNKKSTFMKQNIKNQNKPGLAELNPDETMVEKSNSECSEDDTKSNLIRTTKDTVSHMSSNDLKTQESSLTSNTMRYNYSNKKHLDSNKNHIYESSNSEEEASRKMVAFDVALLQQKALANANKKSDKKKILKKEISDPLLLSPNTFERHKISKKASELLGVNTVDDVLKRQHVLQKINSKHEGTTQDKKDKEKFYNKKLKEIRKFKKSKSKSTEPEYVSKVPFENDEREEQQTGVLELNVFEKKSKSKVKLKKGKGKEKDKKQKIQQEQETNKPSISMKPQESTIFPNVSEETSETFGKVVISEDKNITPPERTLHQQIIPDHLNQPLEIVNETSNVQTTDPKPNTDYPAFSQNLDEMSDTSSLSSHTSNKRVSTVSNSSEKDENERKNDILSQYEDECKNLNSLIEQLLDYNLLIAELSEEIEILSETDNINCTESDLEREENTVLTEIENVKKLLRSVSDLTKYQRAEMNENLALLNKLDLDVCTKKAGYSNLKSGNWRTSSQSAPRRLIQKRNASAGVGVQKKGGTSFV